MTEARVNEILKTKGAAVHWMSTERTVAEVITALAEHGVGALLISTDGRDVRGIVSERDVVRALGRSGPAVLSEPVATIMTRAVQTCSPDDTISEVMARMTTGRFRHVPVMVDDLVVGVVSIGDVVKHRVGQLEAEAQELLDYIHAR